MAYHELPTAVPHPLIWIHGHTSSSEFDIDYFGMDDGTERDPSVNFRFLFQLGQGFYIYLYVIVLRPPESPLLFHTFWIKDCAVIDVDMEELGAPTSVEAHEVHLPVVFRRCALHLQGKPPRILQVREVRFNASVEPTLSLRMSFSLAESETAPTIGFVWENATGWHLSEGDVVTCFQEGDRFEFLDLG